MTSQMSLTTVAFHAMARCGGNPFWRPANAIADGFNSTDNRTSRALVAYACRTMTDASLPEIARSVNARNHSTIAEALGNASAIDDRERTRFCLEVQAQVIGPSRVASQHDPVRAPAAPHIPAPKRKGALVGADEGEREIPVRRGDTRKGTRADGAAESRKAATALPEAKRQRAGRR